MSPDQVRELVLQSFPELKVGPRSDGGWSFFLGVKNPPPNSNRIVRVRGSAVGSSILRVVRSRIEGKQIWVSCSGPEDLKRLVSEEIQQYVDHYQGR